MRYLAQTEDHRLKPVPRSSRNRRILCGADHGGTGFSLWMGGLAADGPSQPHARPVPRRLRRGCRLLRRPLPSRPQPPQAGRSDSALLGRTRQGRSGHAPQPYSAAVLTPAPITRHAAAPPRYRRVPVRRQPQRAPRSRPRPRHLRVDGRFASQSPQRHSHGHRARQRTGLASCRAFFRPRPPRPRRRPRYSRHRLGN